MPEPKSIEAVRIEEAMTRPDKVETDNPVTLYRTYSADEIKAVEKALVRKLDTRILPTIVLIYVLNYVRNISGCSCALLTSS